MDDIFGNTIREGKGLPDLSESDACSVVLKIPAQVKDKDFVLFIEKVTNQGQAPLSFEEIYELERIRERGVIQNPEFKKKFLSMGIVELVGRTRGAKYILSHKYYAHKGKSGVHTRLAGISREKQKVLMLKHFEKNKKGYMQDFQDIFPELKPMDISNLLQELRRAGKVTHRGPKKSGHWELL